MSDLSTGTMLKAPVRSWFNVGVMALAHFMSDYYTAFLPVLLPLIATRYDISYSESAAIYMVFSVAMNFVQPPIGIAADKRNLNYLMPLSVLTGGVFASAVVLSPNLFILLCIVLLCGICSSGFHPVSASILTRVLPHGKKGFGTSIYIAGGNLGFALAPVIVAAFIERFGENYLVLMSLPAIITTALIYVRHLHAPNQQQPGGRCASALNMGKIIRSRQFVFLNTSIALRSWTYCSMVVFIPLLFNEKGYSSMEGATCLVIMLIGAVAGGLIGGALTDKFGPKNVTLGSFVLALIFGVIFLSRCDMSALSLISLFICGAGVYGSTPNAIVWAQRLLPGNAAFAASMMLGFTFGAGYIESVITGMIGDIIGLQDAMLYTTIVTMILAIVLIAVLKAPAPEAADLDLAKAMAASEKADTAEAAASAETSGAAPAATSAAVAAAVAAAAVVPENLESRKE